MRVESSISWRLPQAFMKKFLYALQMILGWPVCQLVLLYLAGQPCLPPGASSNHSNRPQPCCCTPNLKLRLLMHEAFAFPDLIIRHCNWDNMRLQLVPQTYSCPGFPLGLSFPLNLSSLPVPSAVSSCPFSLHHKEHMVHIIQMYVEKVSGW